MSGFPQAGSNFRLVGDWRLLEGQAWHDWQKSAADAAIAAALSRGEVFDAARLRRDLRQLETEGPVEVRLIVDRSAGQTGVG